MTLDIVQSMALLIISLLAIVILLKILAIVHHQTGKVKELEMRMKAMEQLDAADVVPAESSKEN